MKNIIDVKTSYKLCASEIQDFFFFVNLLFAKIDYSTKTSVLKQ